MNLLIFKVTKFGNRFKQIFVLKLRQRKEIRSSYPFQGRPEDGKNNATGYFLYRKHEGLCEGVYDQWNYYHQTIHQFGRSDVAGEKLYPLPSFVYRIA